MEAASFLDQLAARFGVTYRRARLPDGCRALLADGVVLLAEDLTPERAHFAYCHEVAHLRLDHPHRLPRDETEEREQEAEATRLACEMLLPAESFQPLCGRTLTQLKETFPFASYELLARRRLEFRPGLLTIFDNQRLISRLAPDGWNVSRRLFPIEDEVRHSCLTSHQPIALERDGQRVEATYVDEGRGVERVILFLEAEAVEG